MGADYFDPPDKPPLNDMPLGIGRNCQIEGVIIDKNTRFGENVIIQPFPRGTETEGENWSVRDGIVVIPKRTVIQSGTYIGPEDK